MILRKIINFYSYEKVRYLLVGAVNFVFAISLFPILYYLLSISVYVILTIATVLCIIFSFFTHKYFTFKKKNTITVYESFTYILKELIVYINNLIVVTIFIVNFGLNVIYVSVFMAVLNFLLSYIYLKLITFR